MIPNVTHLANTQQKIADGGVLLRLRYITIIYKACHKNKCNSAVHQTFAMEHHPSKQMKAAPAALFSTERGKNREASSTPPQMAIYFNFLSKTTLYTVSSCHSAPLFSAQRLKEGEENARGSRWRRYAPY